MPRPLARPSLLALLVAGSLLVALAPGLAVAAAPARFPTVSLGDRGTDVSAIQLLVRHHQAPAPRGPGTGRGVVVGGINPAVVPIDGIFGATTARGVRAFQGSRDLPASGVVDAATWSALVVALAQGATGDAVRALQHELREKRAAAVPLDGVFGSSTRTAVLAFQAHAGLARTGAADLATWRSLVGHFELAHFSRAGLCDYSSGNGPANWGTAATVAWLETAGTAMVAAGHGRLPVGDISLEHGGDIPGHVSHEHGLDADLRPMHLPNDQCSYGLSWRSPAYDRAATRELVRAIRAAAPGRVRLVWFNDPELLREGLTQAQAGHDDHLHVRFCEDRFPVPAYRC